MTFIASNSPDTDAVCVSLYNLAGAPGRTFDTIGTQEVKPRGFPLLSAGRPAEPFLFVTLPALIYRELVTRGGVRKQCHPDPSCKKQSLLVLAAAKSGAFFFVVVKCLHADKKQEFSSSVRRQSHKKNNQKQHVPSPSVISASR